MYHVIAKTNPDTGFTFYFNYERSDSRPNWTTDLSKARHWTDHATAEKVLKNIGDKDAEVVGVVM